MPNWPAALRLLGMGFFVGVCILLGVLAGLWIDGRYGTRPIFVIVGLFVGMFSAFYGVYQMLLPLLSKKRDRGDT